MPEVWVALKKSLAYTKSLLCDCDVHEPQAAGENDTTECNLQGCLKSKSNLRDMLCGSKRHSESENPSVGFSSRSTMNSEIINSIIQEIEAQIKTNNNFHVPHEQQAYLNPYSTAKSWVSNFVTRKSRERDSSATSESNEMVVSSNRWESIRSNQFNNRSNSICQECGGVFKNSDAMESHHLTKHAVKELTEGHLSRKVIELICQRSWWKSKHEFVHIDKVFKVLNSPRSLSCYEEHREMVKRKASRQRQIRPRCLVDGNEMLRFHGTTIACSLPNYGSEILCKMDRCGVCQILRHGFGKKEESRDGIGVMTCATSGRAFESIELDEEESGEGIRKALMVCRVIAGRIYNVGLENEEEEKGNCAFDSSGVKMDQDSNFEVLHVSSSRAILPCFVVTYKR